MQHPPTSPTPGTRRRRGAPSSAGAFVTAALAAFAVALTATQGAAAPAAPERADRVLVSPEQVPRGQKTSLSVVVGDYIVAGQRRVEVRAPRWNLVGESGTGWVIVAYDRDYGDARVVRVGASGAQSVLVPNAGFETVSLTSDGRYLLRREVLTGGGRLRSQLRVMDATTGELRGSHRFAGVREVLDIDDAWAAVSGGGSQPSVWWKFATAQVRTLDKRRAFFADLSEGLISYGKGDPYRGGCSFLAQAPQPGQASRPGLDMFRSCDWSVVAVAPGGARVLTIPNTTDGIGPHLAQLRVAESGRVLKTYRAASYFGRVAFESPREAILDTHSRRYAAPVRCVLADCERAGQLTRETRSRRASRAHR